jgi:hypothetical protein
MERQIDEGVSSIEDRDVDGGRAGAARIEVVVVPRKTTSVLSRRPEVDAVRDVGVEGNAVDAGACSSRQRRTAVLRERAVGIQRDKELGRRLTRHSLDTRRSRRSRRSRCALSARAPAGPAGPVGPLFPLSAVRAVLLRSFVCSDPLITCFVPTLFPGRSALPAANAVPPSAKNSANNAT